MRTYSKKTKVVVAAVSAGTLAVSGVAYAYWTTSGTGTGTASTQDGLSGFAVAQNTVAGTPLAPGLGTALAGTVKNKDATAPAQLQKLVATIKAPTGAGTDPAKPACAAADYVLSSPGNTWTITSSGGVATINPNVELAKKASGSAVDDTYSFADLKVTMVDRADSAAGVTPVVNGNQDNCKNATFNVTYDAS